MGTKKTKTKKQSSKISKTINFPLSIGQTFQLDNKDFDNYDFTFSMEEYFGFELYSEMNPFTMNELLEKLDLLPEDIQSGYGIDVNDFISEDTVENLDEPANGTCAKLFLEELFTRMNEKTLKDYSESESIYDVVLFDLDTDAAHIEAIEQNKEYLNSRILNNAELYIDKGIRKNIISDMDPDTFRNTIMMVFHYKLNFN